MTDRTLELAKDLRRVKRETDHALVEAGLGLRRAREAAGAKAWPALIAECGLTPARVRQYIRLGGELETSAGVLPPGPAALAVHDVNHLFTAINNALLRLEDTLVTQPSPGASWASTRAQIQAWLGRAREIVGHQAAFLHPPEPERVLVRDAVRDAVAESLLRLGQPSVDGLVEVEHGLHGQLSCEVPRTSLVRALTNVVANALQAAAGPGGVRISAVQGPGPELSLRIEDAGPGLPLEACETLLTGRAPRRTGADLRGWGLCSTHHCVVAHCRGRIEVDARPGGGTSIRFLLPTARPHSS